MTVGGLRSPIGLLGQRDTEGGIVFYKYERVWCFVVWDDVFETRQVAGRSWSLLSSCSGADDSIPLLVPLALGIQARAPVAGQGQAAGIRWQGSRRL